MEFKSQLKKIIRAIKDWLGSYKLKKYVAHNDTLKIVIGASNIFEEGWFPTEEVFLNLLREEDFKRFFQNKKVDVFLSEHVFEHLTVEQADLALRNCYKYLKSGGYIRIAVPDGFHPNPNYIEMVKPGGTGSGADDHKVLYNYQTLETILKQAGFLPKPLEYFDENGNFHFFEWDKKTGMIHRSSRYDERNQHKPLTYTSLIYDGIKP